MAERQGGGRLCSCWPLAASWRAQRAACPSPAKCWKPAFPSALAFSSAPRRTLRASHLNALRNLKGGADELPPLPLPPPLPPPLPLLSPPFAARTSRALAASPSCRALGVGPNTSSARASRSGRGWCLEGSRNVVLTPWGYRGKGEGGGL